MNSYNFNCDVCSLEFRDSKFCASKVILDKTFQTGAYSIPQKKRIKMYQAYNINRDNRTVQRLFYFIFFFHFRHCNVKADIPLPDEKNR